MTRTTSLLLGVFVAGLIAGCGQEAPLAVEPIDHGVTPSLLAQSQASVEIGAGGGSVAVAGVTLTVPPGALTQTTMITLSVNEDASGRHIVLEPQGLPLAAKATLTGTAAGYRERVAWNPASGVWESTGAQAQGGFLRSRVVDLSRYDDFE